MRRLAVVFALVALVLAHSAAAQEGGPRPFSLADLSKLRRVEALEISPDGTAVVYAVRAPAAGGAKTISTVKFQTFPGGEPRELGEGSSPRFSPDGKRVAFFAGEGDEEGIWIQELATGQKRKAVSVHGADPFLGHEADESFAWAPNGRALAFLSAKPPIEGFEEGVKGIWRLMFKTLTGLSDYRHTHVWWVELEGPEAGKARQLTQGHFDHHSIDVSPDGKRVLFVSNRSGQPDRNYSDDLFTIDVATREELRLTATPGPEMHPAYSPDGRQIAYLALRREINTKDSPSEDAHLYLLPSGGGDALELTAKLDRRINEIVWYPDGKSIYFTADDGGIRPVSRVIVPATIAEEPRVESVLLDFAQLSRLSFDRTGKHMAYRRTSFTEPAEGMVTTLAGLSARRVTNENWRVRHENGLRDADRDRFPSFDGTPIEGWVMKPAVMQQGQRYPAILWIHGGPHGMHGYSFSERFHLLSGAGYGVILVNPRGSTGYGQAFSDGTLGAWGQGDYKDLMAWLDGALARHPWIDRERLGVAGGSYGGYMTNWVITQTDRFKAAVSIASLSNLVSFYGTSVYQDLIETEYGLPWEGDNFTRLWSHSPLAHVAKVKTPTLFLHGENDHDVPIEQAEEMFVALNRRGIETYFARYPGEGHAIRKPAFAKNAHRRMLMWFDHFLKPAAQ